MRRGASANARARLEGAPRRSVCRLARRGGDRFEFDRPTAPPCFEPACTASTRPPPHWCSPAAPTASTGPQPRHHQRGPRDRLFLTGAEPLATRDTVVTLFDLDLIHGHYLAPLDTTDDPYGARAAVRTAHVLSLTRHGRDVLSGRAGRGRLPDDHHTPR